jgi:hypothetical protein
MRNTLDIEADVFWLPPKRWRNTWASPPEKWFRASCGSALTGEAPAQASGAAVVAGFRPFAASDQ